MLFEIINPHDPYTIIADDLEIAAVAVCILGEGKYSLKELTGDKSAYVPFFPIDGQDEWFTKWFGRTFEQSVTYASEERGADLAKCLASVMIGDAKNRRAFDEILARAETPEEYTKALGQMHAAKRTSLVDIGHTAWGMADFIHDRYVKPKQVH
jgi:hypothetical protein